MTIEQYWAKNKGTFPKVGVVGVESEWMEAGPLNVTDGKLWAGDPQVMDPSGGCGCIVRVPKGLYRVQVKGMDFKGHKRSSRVRAFLKSVAKPTLGKACGETGTDTAWVGVCDYANYKKAVPRKYGDEYMKDIIGATAESAIGILGFEYGGKSFEMALMESGLGDGAFVVFPLESKGKTVGIEVEFLPPGFKLEDDSSGATKRADAPKIKKADARKFMKVCEKGNVKLAQAMLKQNPNLIHASGPHGVQQEISALHIAASEGQAEVVELLIKHGHPVDSMDQFQCTPLHEAAQYGHADAVRVLLKHKAQVNHLNHVQATPLHRAIYPAPGRAEVVKLLLQAGANPTMKDHFKNTPLKWAKDYLTRGSDEERPEAGKMVELMENAKKKKK